ncbi:GH24 family phage-related lysozyme (muramidase) [Arthrobacter sp. UYNi723]
MVEKNRVAGETPVVQRIPPAETVNTASGQGNTAKPGTKPRRKVTPEEVEAKFAALRARREERQANRSPREMGKLVRVVIASALGVGIVGFALGINNAGEQHTVEVRTNQNKVAALTGALETLTPADGANTKQKLVDGIAAAQKRSDALAAGQQQFAGIAYAGNAEAGTNDGRPKQAVLKSLEHRKVIAGFFAPEALILTDAQAYTFRTEDLLGPGRIDPRQPWYTRYEPANGNEAARKVAAPESYTWKTASVTLSGTPDVLSVVWTNTDTKTGDLLAWATARYSVESDTFRNLSVNRTTQGESQQLKVGTAGSESATAKGAKP